MADELYERYLARAIGEINELGDHIARCDLAPHVHHQPVLGSGHPLADIFLLKYAPEQSEIAEGVAFYGRVGQAVLKSVQRLGIDPLLLYGTNCVKCHDIGDDARRTVCPAWLLQELTIVQPKMIVVMGEPALDVLNGLGVPLSAPLEPEIAVVQRFTPTIEALLVPPIERSLDDAAGKRAFWDAFRALGEWYAALPPVLTLVAAVAAFLAYGHVLAALPRASEAVTVAWIAIVGLPLLGLIVLATGRLHAYPWPLIVAVIASAGGLALLFGAADLPVENAAAKAVFAGTAGLVVARAFRAPLEVALVALAVIAVDIWSVFAGPTKVIVEEHPDLLSDLTAGVAGPGLLAAGALGMTDLFFLGLLAESARAHGLRYGLTAALMVASLGATFALAAGFDRALPALPLMSLAFLGANADLLLARLRR